MVPWNRSSYFGNHHFSVPCDHQATDFNRLVTWIPVQVNQVTRERRIVERDEKAKCSHNWELPLDATWGTLRARSFRTKTWKNPGPFHSGAAFFMDETKKKNSKPKLWWYFWKYGERHAHSTLVLQNDPQFILSGVSFNLRAFTGGLDIYVQVSNEKNLVV